MARRLHSASTYQSLKAPLRVLARQAVPAVRRELRAALGHLGETIDVDKATHLLNHGMGFRIADEAVAFGHFREVLKAPFGRLGTLHEDAGKQGALEINAAFRRARRPVRFFKDSRNRVTDSFAFDRFSVRTQEAIRQSQDRFIAQLSRDARTTIEAVILAGQRTGLTPSEIVADIRDVIGLTDRMALAVMNYRRMLYDLDPGGLTRQLSNYADDDLFRAALDSGVPLQDAVIEQMVSNYEDNYLDYRANMIAQTESIRAANAGLRDSYTQAVDRGALAEGSVTRQWKVSLDERTCPVCLSIPEMNPDGVGLDEDFASIDGPMGDPPDPHPNCRCSVDFITNLDMLPAYEEDAADAAA